MRTETDVDASTGVAARELPVLKFRGIITRSGAAALVDSLRVRLGLPREIYESAVQPAIEAYAEFVQFLPEATSTTHSDSGGLFRRALERTSLALDYRRGKILPPDAVPEAIGEQSHRWTYAVFIAALLHDVAAPIARLRVTMCDRCGGVALWDPHAGSLSELGAMRYRVECIDGAAPQARIFVELPHLLFMRFVPLFIQEWLAADATLARELSALLSGVPAARQSAIGALVLRAHGVTAGRTAKAEHSTTATAIIAEPQDLKRGAHGQKATDAQRPMPTHVNAEDVMARAPDAAHHFMHWLQGGIADRSIPINEANAWVHVVAEGMLLVSPRVFREYLKGLVAEGNSGPRSSSSHDTEAVKAIQRELLRSGWHLRGKQGINMLTYQVTSRGRGVSRIHGVVIRHPERFVNPLPPANSGLVLMPVTGDAE